MQDLHAIPMVPQAELLVPGWHMPPEQQPILHVAALQPPPDPELEPEAEPLLLPELAIEHEPVRHCPPDAVQS